MGVTRRLEIPAPVPTPYPRGFGRRRDTGRVAGEHRRGAADLDIYSAGLEQGNPDAWSAAFDEGLIAKESTITPAGELPGTKTYVGREGFLEFVEGWTDEFAELKMRLETAIEAGENWVVALVHQSAKGRGSGADVELRFWIVYTLKGGQVIDRRHYLSEREALEAAGLRE